MSPALRASDLAGTLELARARLHEGASAKAISALESALEAAEASAEPFDRATCGVLGELLLEAYSRVGESEARARAAARCYAIGARTRNVILLAAAQAALIEKRLDPAALNCYVDAVALGDDVDAALLSRLHQTLAFALHVDLPLPPAEGDPRIDVLVRLRALRPRLTYARLYLGRFRYLTGDYEAAISELLAITGKLAESTKVLNILGRSLEKLGRVRESAAVYRRSLGADRAQPGIQFRLGRILLAAFGDGLSRI